MGKRVRTACLVILGAIAPGAALAAGDAAEEPAEPRNRVSFSVSRQARVENDRASAVVAVTDEDADAAELAERVNRTMTWALEEAKTEPRVEVRSGNYRTFPVSHESRIRRWRARQELVLESADTEALAGLLGELQTRVELASIDFSIAPETRRAAEDDLIAQALAAFRARAEIVREGLGAAGYQVVEVQLHTGGAGPPIAYATRNLAQAEAAPPALEAGSSQITVTASGTIALE